MKPPRTAKQIVIVSGKGGSGKTFVSSSLASIATHAVLADCDVDAANLHLMLAPRDVACTSFVSGNVATVDAERCTGCGLCEAACRFQAIHHREAGAVAQVDAMACEGCAVCELVCPAGAISLRPQERGTWCRATTNYGPLAYARLDPGEENSGKLVDQVRREALAQAEAARAEWILIDGPPGTGCATRSAITGTDYVVIVTEPTRSGIHDMSRVIELAEHFSVPMGVVMNKSTLSPPYAEHLRTLTEKRGLPLLGEIPFTREIPEALTQLVPYPEWLDDEVTHEVHAIWDAIRTLR